MVLGDEGMGLFQAMGLHQDLIGHNLFYGPGGNNPAFIQYNHLPAGLQEKLLPPLSAWPIITSEDPLYSPLLWGRKANLRD